uniref:Uncharacterized protein n=1 Tax=Oryza rufipogon TaxID=4529 RepID=A0A0E0MUA9_ORYRU
MDRYRVAPRPVYLSTAAAGGDHGDGPRRLPRGVAGGGGGGAELDIFSAERYFNADDVVKKECEQPRQEVAVDAASQSGRTVACSSEASWTSRSGLLSGHAQSAASAGAAAKLQMAGRGDAAVARMAKREHCAGRKAVTVDVASEQRSPVTPRTHARFDNSHVVADSTIFKANAPPPPPPPPCEEEPVKMKISPGSSTFPPPLANSIFAAAPNRGGGGGGAAPPPIVGRRVVSSGGFTFPVAVGAAKVVSTVGDEPPRESLEVFRPIDEESVLADPPADHLATVGGRGGGGGGGGLAAGFARAPGVAAVATDEEAMSDASSDLFDLESFAASSSFPTTCRGRSSRRNSREEEEDDGLPYGGAAAAAVEPALSECMYAPSEVSVVWSVATAEGGAFDAASVANFSSAASACCVEEFSFVPPPDSAATAAAGGHEGFTAAMSRSAARKKGGGGFLSSCRCEKAVSVGPTPVRMVRPEVNVKTTGGGHAAGLAGGGAARYHPGRVRMPVRT